MLKQFLIYLTLGLSFFSPLLATSTEALPVVTTETQIQKVDRHFVLTTLLFCKGLPRYREISLSGYCPIKGKTAELEKFMLNKDDKVVLAAKVQDYVALQWNGFIPGETIKLIFETSEATVHEMWLTPIPIKAASSDTAISVEAELCSLVPVTYNIRLKGLEEGEKYVFQSFSGGEIIRDEKTYNAAHQLFASPGIINRKGGHGEVTLTIRNENLTLMLPWGQDLLDYATGKRNYYSISLSKKPSFSEAIKGHITSENTQYLN